jgi:hypothetical protein
MNDRDPIAELLDFGFGLPERVRTDSTDCDILRYLHRQLADLEAQIRAEANIQEQAERDRSAEPSGPYVGYAPLGIQGYKQDW